MVVIHRSRPPRAPCARRARRSGFQRRPPVDVRLLTIFLLRFILRSSIADAVRADPRSSQQPAPRPSRHAAPVALLADGNATHRDSDKRMGDHLSPDVDEDTPPPVPPKSPLRFNRAESVSSQMPTDISPAVCTFSQFQSDVGHSYRTTVNGTATSPEGVPGARAILTSPHVSTPAGHDSSSSPKAPHARPSMEPATRKASSVRVRRNKLHKTRQHSLPPSSFRQSLFGSLLARAFGSHDASCVSSRSSSSPSMSDRPYRSTRSVSDSGHSAAKRPLPSSRSSDTTDSSCTTDSSGSTAFSYASTALTTPDGSPPSLSPRNSTKGVRTNRLHKRRPPLAPSGVYQYPPGGHAAALGRSQSTPDDLGQRAPTRRNWSSVEEARYAAEETDSLAYGPDPTSWYTSVSLLACCALSPGSDVLTAPHAIRPVVTKCSLPPSTMTSCGNPLATVDGPLVASARFAARVDAGPDLRSPQQTLFACARAAGLHWLMLYLRRGPVFPDCSAG